MASLFSAELASGGLFISDGTGVDRKTVNRLDDQSAALDWWIHDDADIGDLANIYRYVNKDKKFAYSTSPFGIKNGNKYKNNSFLILLSRPTPAILMALAGQLDLSTN